MAKTKFSPEFLANQRREAAIARWRDDVFREKASQAISRAAMKPERRAATAERLRRQWADPEWRARQRAAITAAAARPEVRARLKAAQSHPDRRLAQAITARDIWAKRDRVRRVRGPFFADGKPTRCECCGQWFTKSRLPELDHKLAIMFGGTDAPANANYLCPACHSYKSRNELRILAAINRQKAA